MSRRHRRPSPGERGDGTPGPALVVNGVAHELPPGDGRTLLSYLRDELQLTGAKHGCDRGECGACAVLVGGRARPSCLTITATVDADIVTIEGLAEQITDLREAFADLGAFQCGYCTPGQLVAAESYLRAGGPAVEGEIRFQMQGNVCRCTGYAQIVAAIERVAAERAEAERA